MYIYICYTCHCRLRLGKYVSITIITATYAHNYNVYTIQLLCNILSTSFNFIDFIMYLRLFVSVLFNGKTSFITCY